MTPRRGGAGDEREALDRLARDLERLRPEERCSFEAELHAQLVDEYGRTRASRAKSRATFAWGRWATGAAAVAATAAVVVCGAHAALGRFAEPGSPVSAATSSAPLPRVIEAPPPESEAAPESVAPASSFAATAEDLPSAKLPALADRDLARRTVAREYPEDLQRAGIGGTVVLLTWVTPDGVADRPRVGASSGVRDLDDAALRAMHSLRFDPATRGGRAVGTWIEFSIRFEPDAALPQPSPEYHPFQIPLSN